MLHYKYASHFDKFLITVGIFLSIVTGISTSLFTITYGKVVSSIITYAKKINSSSEIEEKTEAVEELMHGVKIFVLENCTLGVVSFCLGYVAFILFNNSAVKQIHRLRLLYFEKILNQDIPWYDVNQTTDFTSRMTTDLKKIEEALGENMYALIFSAAQCLTCLIIIMVNGWELALICLTPFVVSFILMMILKKISSKLTKMETDAYASANSVAEEAFTFIKTVVAFSGQKKEEESYDKFLLEAKRSNIRKSLLLAAFNVLRLFSLNVSWSLCFWLGVKLVAGKEETGYTLHQLILIYVAITRLIHTFVTSQSYLEILINAQGATEKIFKVINSVPIINTSKGKGKNFNSIQGVIIFDNVSFSYPSRPDVMVLKSLNLKITAGETVALVGCSGCGKSTCVQLIQRFYDLVEGQICVDGTNLKELDLNWLRQHIGVVSQEPTLFETTIAENIKLGCPNATPDDIKEAAKKAYAHTFISNLPQGYNTVVGERGVQLSGGQKQRIAIARALVRKPSILLLDEATSALDANSEALVQIAMDLASAKCTTIIVAHRLSTVKKANRILVLADGKIQEDGTHDALMESQGIYYHLLCSQIKSDVIQDSDLISREGIVNENYSKENVSALQTGEDVKVESTSVKPTSLCLWLIKNMSCSEICYVTIGFILSILGGTLISLYAFIFGAIIGVFASDGPNTLQTNINKYCLVFLAFGGLKAISNSLEAYMFSAAAEMLNMRLRRRTFAAILNQEVGWFDRKENGVGSLCAQLSGAVHLQGVLGSVVAVCLDTIFVLLFAVITSFYFEWRLALIVLCFSPVMIVVFYFTRSLLLKLNQYHHQSIKLSSKIANEAISGIRTLASLCCENRFQDMYKSALSPYYDEAMKKAHVCALISSILKSFLFFAYTAPIYYGARLIAEKGVSPSTVFTSIEALVVSLWFLGNSLNRLPSLYGALISVRRIFNFLSNSPTNQDHGRYNQKWGEGNISYEKVQFAYPTRPLVQVLKGVDLSVFQGKTVALVGPSGCGKSTIVQLLMRFYDLKQGKISIDGKSTKEMDGKHLRAHLGVVLQEPNLFNRTIAENIAYGDNAKKASMAEVIDAAKRANIHAFISMLPLGYNTNLGEKGTQLSGGQKQRVAIARALIRNPMVLLLDEAMSALDASNERMVQKALTDAKNGRSCITIAHSLSAIRGADVICAINHGRIIEMGTHLELMCKRGFYYELYSLHEKHN